MTGALPIPLTVPVRPPPAPFELGDPLPRGVTLLEASAGTGKTFTIAALVTRYIAEGLPLAHLLVVTFTRMATGELRERVRDGLVRAADALGRALEGVPPDPAETVARLLSEGSEHVVAERHRRLSSALADFDAATIETTHGFCLQVLAGLGTAGNVERGATLVEDAGDLLREVVDDLYVRRFSPHPDPLRFDPAVARRLGAAVLGQPAAAVLPALGDARNMPAIRRRLVEAVAREMDRRKRMDNVLTYDDVLLRLREALADPVRGPLALARLADHHRVVLIDEFQDTDPVQWEIVRRAFGGAGSTLVLIGDPKQAIYAFRGGDVFAYLQAAGEAGAEGTLAVNWRSDGSLLAAYDALFADSQLGHAGIVYRRVRAAPGNEEMRLVGTPSPAPLRVRILHRADNLVPLTATRRLPVKPDARALVAADVAADIVALLSSDAKILTRDAGGSVVGTERVRPGHVAVLVRRHGDANTVQRELLRRGVPAVVAGGASVFATDPADEWLRLLRALERPTSRTRAATLALTAFVGWDAAAVATADEAEFERLHERLHRWAGILRRRGVAALLDDVVVTGRVPARVLSRLDGERFLTDMRHAAQLLHQAAVTEGLGPSALTAWLRRRISEAGDDAGNEDRTRRLESDAEAVQVLTIYRSKGLEFGIVYCPFAWDASDRLDDQPVFHDPDHGQRRTIDVGGGGRGFRAHQRQALVEQRGEDLRLLYVALTRARHQAVLWWVGAQDAEHSALSRLLFSRGPDGTVEPSGRASLSDDQVDAAVSRLGAGISAERVSAAAAARWAPSRTPVPELDLASFDRALDRGWRRASYSSITRPLEDHVVGSEAEDQVTTDEDPVGGASLVSGGTGGETDGDLQTVPLLLAGMPGGARVGTVVHSVLEVVDFAAGDLTAELWTALQGPLAGPATALGDLTAAVDGLQAAIETPLGPLVDGRRLRDVGRQDRIDEMAFELPVTGGDAPEGELSVGDIADVLTATLPGDDPVARYAHRLTDPSLDVALRGYLTGSLDLVFRLPDERYLLADYKTNRLGTPGSPLRAADYRPDALHTEMEAAHYPLQGLLYTVALHRYLRWRVPRYEPARHLGGVLYLFLRGMTGVGNPSIGDRPLGVWSWRPPPATVVALSDLFDRGRTG